jgi:hypothetical protein
MLAMYDADVAGLLVVYNLNQPTQDFGRDYDAIEEHLAGQGHADRLLGSTWFVQTDLTPPELRDGLVAHGAVDAADQLLVVDLRSPDWAQAGLPHLPAWFARAAGPALLVAYHRHKPPVADYLRQQGDLIQLLPSTWVVLTDERAEDLRDRLVAGEVVDPTDRLLVIDLPSPTWAEVGMPHLPGLTGDGPALLVIYEHRPLSVSRYLRKLRRWWHGLRSTWIVETPLNPDELLADMRAQHVVDLADEVLIVDFRSARWAGLGLASINLNTAPPRDLEHIVHVGPERAEQIVAGRPWVSVHELSRIPGIGAERLAEIRAQAIARAP